MAGWSGRMYAAQGSASSTKCGNERSSQPGVCVVVIATDARVQHFPSGARGCPRLRQSFAGIIVLNSHGSNGMHWHSTHSLLTRHLSRVLMSPLSAISPCGASQLLAHVSSPCTSCPCFMHEHKGTRSRLVRIPHRWALRIEGWDRSRASVRPPYILSTFVNFLVHAAISVSLQV